MPLYKQLSLLLKLINNSPSLNIGNQNSDGIWSYLVSREFYDFISPFCPSFSFDLACSRISVVGDERKRARKKRGRTKARICSRLSEVGDGVKKESERRNEGGLRRGLRP